jgi:sec-independent protein translocase protein TatB
MFGIGLPELLVILVVALIVLGPKRLPEVARQLGKAVGEFRRQTSDLMDDFQAQLRIDEDAEHRERAAHAAAAARAAAPVPGAVASAAAPPPTPPSEAPPADAAGSVGAPAPPAGTSRA